MRLLQAFADQAAVAVLNARLFQQTQKVAISKERERLARELHDAVTQTLFSASILAEALPAQWESDREGALATLEKLRRLTRGALGEMRTLLLELRPDALTDVGLESLLRHLGEAFTGNTLVPVALRAAPADLRLPADVQIAFYRIAQEALNNIAKHADATGVTITLLARAGVVSLSIADDGRGFDAGLRTAGRLGLAIMRERAHAVDAQLEVTSAPGQGTTVLLQWRDQSKLETPAGRWASETPEQPAGAGENQAPEQPPGAAQQGARVPLPAGAPQDPSTAIGHRAGEGKR
jgi:two-component system nitrate/nitrite sensor histidine kinase NarX